MNDQTNHSIIFPFAKSLKLNDDINPKSILNFSNKTTSQLQNNNPDNILNSPTAFHCGQDKFGNSRGFCTICQDKCPSYSQIGIDDLRCGRCFCGASAHKLFSFEDLDLKGFIEIMTKDIIPKLNEDITSKGINFDSFLVMYKLTDPNANKNQFSWLYQLLRDAGFTILKAEIKQLRKDKINDSKLDNLMQNIHNFYIENDDHKTNYSLSMNKYDIDHALIERRHVHGKDTTFRKLSKLDEMFHFLTFNKKHEMPNQENNGSEYNNKIELRGTNLCQTIAEEKMKTIIFSNYHIHKKYYQEFNEPVLVLCLSLDERNIVPYFEKFHYAIHHSDITLTKAVSTINLIYYSKSKINALWDVQVMFPELFKVNKIFQLVQPKHRKKGDFHKAFSVYKDALYSNGFNLAEQKDFATLQQLKVFYDNKVKNTKEIIESLTTCDFYDNYITNKKMSELPCSLLEITNVGCDKEINYMSTVLAFNGDLTLIGYDEMEEVEELSNFFFNLDRLNSLTSFDRVTLIFRPYVLRCGLNDILLNIFRINNFEVLSRKITMLTKEQIIYLYFHEFPTQAAISFGEYEHMMTDTNVEIVILSKFSALVDVHTLLGYSKHEINVNQFNILEHNISYAKMKVEYELQTKEDDIDHPSMRMKNIVETFKSAKRVERKEDKNTFKDIASLIDINEIMTSIIKETQKLHPHDLYSKLQSQKNALLKFASFFNLFVYCNKNKIISEEEVNYFFPKYGEIQEVFIFTRNLDNIKRSLIVMKFEILEVFDIMLTEEEFQRLFEDYLVKGFLNNFEYDQMMQQLTKMKIKLVRLVKPGGFSELKKIICKENFRFLKPNIHKRNKPQYSSTSIVGFHNINDNQNLVYDSLRDNIYVLDSSVDIEYFYQKNLEKIYRIEGGYINEILKENEFIMADIIKSCIKCTVGENMRYERKSSVENASMIERYLNFYHFYKDVKIESYFIELLKYYMFPRFNNNKIEMANLQSKFYEYIDNNEDINPRLSYCVESSNLGFYEVRIPILEYYASNGWVYIETMQYLINRYYLYSDDNFYDELMQKNQNDILLSHFPFEKNSLNKFLNFDTINEVLKNYSTNFNLNDLNFSENEAEIQRRIFYLTKFESVKLFYKKCIKESPNSHIVPQNYHYRIKPDDIYMNINRIYEVEEFGGLFFIEIIIQDYLKYLPMERGTKVENGRIVEYTRRIDSTFYPSRNLQSSLPCYLWGRKLMKICNIIEDSDDSPVSHYGPCIYYPMTQKIGGVINDKYIKEYEMYLYVNIIEDIRTCGVDFFDRETFDIIERKVYEVLDTDIFKTTRIKENVRLMPIRILESNLRVGKRNPITDRNETSFQIDPKHEMKLHSFFKKGEDSNYDEVQLVKTQGDLMKSIQERLNETKSLNETDNKDDMTNDILSKNVYLIDLFCCNGMKFHMYAAFQFLLNVYYRKISRKSDLILFPSVNEEERENEYDLALNALIAGFHSHTQINYKMFNDKDRYNAYNIEFFFYCLKEIKYRLNEIAMYRNKINIIQNAFNKYNQDNEETEELANIRSKFEDMIEKNTNELKIIVKEARECKLQQSEEDLDEYTYVYAPKERYYIPVYMNEKWEKDLNNPKYMKTEKMEYHFLKNLDQLKEGKERQIYSSTGFRIANDYFLVQRTMLRNPEPEIRDKIILEKKKKDKTGGESKFLGQMLKTNLGGNIFKRGGQTTNKENDEKDKSKTNTKTNNTLSGWLNPFSSK